MAHDDEDSRAVDPNDETLAFLIVLPRCRWWFVDSSALSALSPRFPPALASPADPFEDLT